MKKVQKTVAAILKREFQGIPVVDAKHELRIFIKEEDLCSAVRKDQFCCVYAQACKRSYDAQRVIILRTIAYVELPQTDGKRKIERFYMTEAMQEVVRKFDRGEPIEAGTCFILSPPPPGRTMDYSLVKKREQRKARNEKTSALLVGTREELAQEDKDSRRGKGRRQPKLMADVSIRSGTGKIQFAKKSEK